jgi:hypothetical protein
MAADPAAVDRPMRIPADTFETTLKIQEFD